MRSPTALLIAILVAGAVGLGVAGFSNERSQAFTLGVPRSAPVKLKAGDEACQGPIAVPKDAAFEGVTFAVGTRDRPGQPLDVSLRAGDATGTPIARGTLRAGYPDVADVPEHTVWVGHVPDGRTVTACVTNRGRRAAFLYAAADAAARGSTGSIDGRAVGADFAFDFTRRDPRSLVALLPAVFERASLFRADGIGTWTYFVLAALVVLAVPGLLVWALRVTRTER
jgi:hypothetical protein